MATVPGNQFQQRMAQVAREIKKPSYGVLGSTLGTVVKVYGRESIEDGNLPREVNLLISRHPGRLYAKVQIAGSKRELYLPFRDSPELLYTVYGDAKLIEGRTVDILYYDRNVHLGELVVSGNKKGAIRDTTSSTNVFDIGSIF